MALQIASSTALTNAAESGANTETIVGGVQLGQVGAPGQSTVLLAASITVTPGASIASVRLRWRRGTLTGTAVRDSGVLLMPAAAASLGQYTFIAVDTPAQGDVPLLYVLTFQGASEGGAAAFNSFHGFAIAG